MRTDKYTDTYDEIAQYKLVYGLGSGLAVWFGMVLLTFAHRTNYVSSRSRSIMWMSLRWFEDAVAAFSARLLPLRVSLRVGKPTLAALLKKRGELYNRVMQLAQELELPEDPEVYFRTAGGTREREDHGSLGLEREVLLAETPTQARLERGSTTLR